MLSFDTGCSTVVDTRFSADEMDCAVLRAERPCECRPNMAVECSPCWSRRRILGRHTYNLAVADTPPPDPEPPKPTLAERELDVIARIERILEESLDGIV